MLCDESAQLNPLKWLHRDSSGTKSDNSRSILIYSLIK